MIVTDGVFPVSGHLAPLADYAEVIAGYDQALMCIDDAHGVGVLGAKGRGSLEHCGVSGRHIHAAGTLSKAFGGFGGVIAGDGELIDRMKRSVMLLSGASLPPVPGAAAGAMGLKLLMQQPDMLGTLAANVKRLRDGLRGQGFAVEDSPVPIVNLTMETDLQHVCTRLAEEDIVVRRVGPHGYSDAPAGESLRLAVFSTHTPEQIDRLVDGLGALA